MLEGRHVVADATNTYDFNLNGDPWPTVLASLAQFGLPAGSVEDVFQFATHKRPDLLLGKVLNNVLRFQALKLGLEPISSTVIHKIVGMNNLDGCWRQRADGDIDTIETPRSEIVGTVPMIVYHGTCEAFLAGILQDGLLTDRPARWENGGRGHVYLAAEAQVAAFHARKTAQEENSSPIVLQCRMPAHWVADHDVEHQMVNNPLVPGQDGRYFAQEAGLFAAPEPVPPVDILEVRRPALHTRFGTWATVP